MVSPLVIGIIAVVIILLAILIFHYFELKKAAVANNTTVAALVTAPSTDPTVNGGTYTGTTIPTVASSTKLLASKVVAAATSVTTPAGSYTAYNINYPGDDIQVPQFAYVSDDDCKKRCDAIPNCAGVFSWGTGCSFKQLAGLPAPETSSYVTYWKGPPATPPGYTA